MSSRKLSVIVSFMLIALIGGIPSCSGQDTSGDTPCMILAKAGELYTIELVSRSTNDAHNITLSFDYQEEYSERLAVQSPYRKETSDPANGVYVIFIDSIILCDVQYEGLESVLLAETRAKLSVTSEDFYVHLSGIQVEQAEVQYNLPLSFRIVILLFTALPFFLLVPDAIEELQEHLDTDTGTRGVYGRILSILFPLISVALTLLLLGALDILG